MVTVTGCRCRATSEAATKITAAMSTLTRSEEMTKTMMRMIPAQ